MRRLSKWSVWLIAALILVGCQKTTTKETAGSYTSGKIRLDQLKVIQPKILGLSEDSGIRVYSSGNRLYVGADEDTQTRVTEYLEWLSFKSDCHFATGVIRGNVVLSGIDPSPQFTFFHELGEFVLDTELIRDLETIGVAIPGYSERQLRPNSVAVLNPKEVVCDQATTGARICDACGGNCRGNELATCTGGGVGWGNSNTWSWRATLRHDPTAYSPTAVEQQKQIEKACKSAGWRGPECQLHAIACASDLGWSEASCAPLMRSQCAADEPCISGCLHASAWEEGICLTGEN